MGASVGVRLRPDALPSKPPARNGLSMLKPKHPGRGWLAGVNQGNYAG